MASFIVRQSRDGSILIEAENEEAAIETARQISPDDDRWDWSWSNLDAEKERT